LNPIDPARLRELLSYDPDTGEIRWLPGAVKGRMAAGGPVGLQKGRSNSRVYFRFEIGGRRYFAHRVAWALMTGEWPKKTIDHRDRNGLNNVWTNLREATSAQQAQNRKLYSTNRFSGHRGVTWAFGKWKAVIEVSGRSIYLGRFADLQSAINARLVAEREHFTHAQAA
jgi:hypothetical protein